MTAKLSESFVLGEISCKNMRARFAKLKIG